MALLGVANGACSSDSGASSEWSTMPSGTESASTTGVSGVAPASGPTQTASSGSGPEASVGSVDSPSNGSSASTSSTVPSTNAAELPARTWRLTHDEYRAAVRQLLEVDVDLSNFAPESGNGTFVNFSSTSFVRVDLASNYLSLAKKLAADLPRAQLSSLTSCALEASCSQTFIAELGRKAFRQPVSPEAIARYQTIIDTAVEGGDVEAGFRAVLTAMLNSPLFLYRKETGAVADQNAAAFTLTSHEIAEQLSFSLLGAPPPPWLSELADTQVLSEPTALRSAITRLLDEPQASAQLAAFLTQWLEVHDFAEVTKSDVFPGFAEAQPLMQQELEAFLEANGTRTNTLEDLFLGPIPQTSRALTQYYLSEKSAQPGSKRNGVLGLGAVLADHAKSYLTSPTLRGTFIRRRFFCQEITLPPDFTPPPLSETEALKTARTTRELYEKHQTDPMCATCHKLTDYVGYVLEGFDGGGRFRTRDTTQGYDDPINLVTELTSSDVNRPLNSPDDLSQALVESAQVRQCMAQQAFRFYFGQGERTARVPPIQNGSQNLNGGTLGELLTGLFTTESTYRRVRESAL